MYVHGFTEYAADSETKYGDVADSSHDTLSGWSDAPINALPQYGLSEELEKATQPFVAVFQTGLSV